MARDTAFYGPRSRQNARLLIEAAKVLGIPTGEVRTQTGGYVVPAAIVDHINGQVFEPQDEDTTVVEEGQVEIVPETASRPSQSDSKAVWLAYAQANGLDVTDDNTKAEIVEAVKAEEEND